ncbi:MAG: hypothetical protein ACR2I8_04195 [Steroidobacteraceae bacterium]
MNQVTRTAAALLAVALPLVCGTAARAGTGSGAGEAATEAAPSAAVWVDHETSFVYFGQTTYYSCTGLRDKVRYLMQRLGARPDDLRVRVSCAEAGGAGVELMPRVQIRAALPAPATAERLQALAGDPKRELTARVRGDSLDVTPVQFPAIRRLVRIDGRHGDHIEDGDCELLEQMVRQVFPALGIGVAEGSRLACMRNQVPIGSVHLLLETLQRAPDPDQAPVRKD